MASTVSHLFTLDPTRVYPTLERGEGIYVFDRSGKRYLDAIAGIGVVNVGYGRREVAEAMAEQAARLPFAASNVFSSGPAEELAALVARLTPGSLDSVIFATGGSEAVEIAVKMARQYHLEQGQPSRHLVISRWTSYHGATLAGLSLSGSKPRRAKYQPMLIPFPHIPPSYCYRCPWNLTYPSCGVACADALQAELEAVGPDQVAAFIAEPIVASVGGAIAPPDEYFPRIREICDEYGILLIADEIVTGFGRTGSNFALDRWKVVPDLLVMGKGMAGGYAPVSAVAAKSDIRRAFVSNQSAFDHIFTFGGNPVSMAASIAVIKIWEEERLTDNARDLSGYFRAGLEHLRHHRIVGDVRSTGLMGAIEFVADRSTRDPFPAETRLSRLVQQAGLARGVVTYPGVGMADGVRGDIISLYPPLIFSRQDIDHLVELLDATLSDVERSLTL